MKILNFLKNKEIKNAGWIIGEQIFQMVVSLVIGVISARYLGPKNYGALNYTASFVTFFLAIATLSSEGVVLKKIIEHPDKEGEYLGTNLVFRLCSSLVSIVLIAIVVYVLNPGETIKLLLVLLQSTQLLFRAFFILDSWFQRYLKAKYISIGKMVACIVVAVYKIFLLVTSKSIIWFAASNALTDLVISVLLLIFYKRENGQAFKFNFRCGTEVLSQSYHFIISGIMTSLYGQMDRIMIGQSLSDADVGYYTVGSALCSMWIFVPIAIINSFRPSIMELKKRGEEEKYIVRLEQLYSAIIWLCIVVSVGVMLLGKLAIHLLYGPEYYPAITALRIVIWCEVFSMIGSARGIWILSENKNKYVKYYLFIGVIVNLILNAVLIPIFGISGAAFATLITQICTSVIAPLLFKQTRVHTKLVWEAFCLKWYWKGMGKK